MGEGDTEREGEGERERGSHLLLNRIISVKADREIEMSITTNLQSAP